MATGKETTAYQIGLIVSVVLVLVLGITTFMFYKAEEEALKSRKVAQEEKQEAEEKTREVQSRLDTLKNVVGKKSDPADPVEDIMGEFVSHQDMFAETYPNNKAADPQAANYPEMLVFLTDANKELHNQLAEKNVQMKQLEVQFKGEQDKKDAEIVKLRADFDDQARQIREHHEEFQEARSQHETEKEVFSKRVDQTLKDKAESEKKLEKDVLAYDQKLTEKMEILAGAKKELLKSREVNLESPDGEILWINQSARTAYINLGYGDGLRQQTSFSVYGDDVTNAFDAKPKGTIEVIRIDKEHLAVAKITSDNFKDPLVKGDRLISSIFHRDRPERFAIAGLVDINGDGRSDLEMLLNLIERNGGKIDVFVDEEGSRGPQPDSKLTEQTKFLVLGKAPDDKSEQKFRKAYSQIRDSAQDYGVKSMPLTDLLNYMGYTGRERSVGLGNRANAKDFSPRNKKDSSPFRRRPSG